eukprot:4574586-Prymnesium_polylepis.1
MKALLRMIKHATSVSYPGVIDSVAWPPSTGLLARSRVASVPDVSNTHRRRVLLRAQRERAPTKSGHGRQNT